MTEGTVGKGFASMRGLCISLEQGAQNNCNVALESFLERFFSFKLQSQYKPFLTILFVWPLRDVLFCHFKSCHSSNCSVVLEVLVCLFLFTSLSFLLHKFKPRQIHFLPFFQLLRPFLIWSCNFSNINCFQSRFFPKTNMWFYSRVLYFCEL